MFTTAQVLEARAPSIYNALIGAGHRPKADKYAYALFCSPFREDKNASLKVDKNENLFIDYGTGDFGDFIAFTQRAKSMSFTEAMNYILSDSFSMECRTVPTSEEYEASMTVRRVKPLQNLALIRYIESRGICAEIARQYCQEAYYSTGKGNFFSIAFANEGGGYELRNAYFKGCTGHKSPTYLPSPHETNRLAIFEGFFDFLASATYWKQRGKPFAAHVVVLNSLTQMRKALPKLEGKQCFAFLDNDRAGTNALRALRASFDVQDCSRIYHGYKDFCDFLAKAQAFASAQNAVGCNTEAGAKEGAS